MTFESDKDRDEFNRKLDGWYNLGVNIIPMNSSVNVPVIDEWIPWRDKRVPPELYEYWKREHIFDKGAAVILGRAWGKEQLVGKDKDPVQYYLWCIDCDSNGALDEIGILDNIKRDCIIEYHEDELGRGHIFGFSTHELPDKRLVDGNLIIEVFGESKHLMNISPSIHKNGFPWERPENCTTIPSVSDNIVNYLDKVFRRHGQEYLTNSNGNTNREPVSRIGKPKITVGNRHVELRSLICSLISKNSNGFDKELLRKFSYEINQTECETPLPEKEISELYDSCWTFIENNRSSGRSKQQGATATSKISVLEAKRKHAGTWTIIGKIVTVSNMYVIEVAANPPDTEIEYKDAKSIQLEDIEKLDDNERLDVVLYNDDIINVIAGEVVQITGSIILHDVVKSKKQGQIKIKKVVVNATSIKYLNRKELVVTHKDIENINKFATYPNLTERLTAMFAPNVIGHNHIKLGVLRSIVGGDDHGQRGGGRVNTFLVGDPGTAKSTIGQEAARIKPNSRHVSAPHASSKTITAIADKENETVSLKLGAIPLARGAICAIDEITAFPLEEQGRLLGVLEEGEFPLDKHGMSWRIPAPTTIIATANPMGSRWSSRDIISIDEIAMLKTLFDRFQQVYYFRDDMSEEQIDHFVSAMSAINKRKPHNYNFLKKYIIYASAIEVKTITPEAELMLNQFWKDAKIARNVGVRMYVGLYSIAQAQAKLQLRDTVDADIAKNTIELVQIMMAQTGSTVKSPTNPKTVTYKKFLEILQNSAVGIDIRELCKIACKEDQQIALYLGNNWTLKHNRRLQVVIGMLRNHSDVKEIRSNPVVFQWLGSEGDKRDTCDRDPELKNMVSYDERQSNQNENESEVRSRVSHMSPRNQTNEPIPQTTCPKCSEPLFSDPYMAKHHNCEGTD